MLLLCVVLLELLKLLVEWLLLDLLMLDVLLLVLDDDGGVATGAVERVRLGDYKGGSVTWVVSGGNQRVLMGVGGVRHDRRWAQRRLALHLGHGHRRDGQRLWADGSGRLGGLVNSGGST